MSLTRHRHEHVDPEGDKAIVNTAFMRSGQAFLFTTGLGVYLTAQEAVDFARATLRAAGVTDYAVQPTTSSEGN